MIQDIKVEGGTLGSYKNLMPKPKEKRSELVGTMVTIAAKDFLESVADNNDRSLSYVASALLMRGIAACKRDGKLFEPDAEGGRENGGGSAEPAQPPTVRVSRKKLGKKGAEKKRETA